jgi:hypothetical protein
MAIRTGRQAGKAKSVTTVPAVALAEAGQLTHIVRVSGAFFYCLRIQNFEPLLGRVYDVNLPP